MLTTAKQAQEEQKQRLSEVVPLPRRARAEQLAEDQAEIETGDMNQLPLEDVVVLAQMCAPHAAGLVTVESVRKSGGHYGLVLARCNVPQGLCG